MKSQVWWHTPIIPALGRPRQEDYKFKASLGYRAKSFLKNKHNSKKFKKNKNFKNYSICRFWYCLRFQAPSGGLRRNPLGIPYCVYMNPK
jgi:hypothetical protein